jgi:hypothetical protein
MDIMNNIKSFLGKQVDVNDAVVSETITVGPRHSEEHLNTLTKKEVIAYAHKYDISFNSRKSKEELIKIIIRS